MTFLSFLILKIRFAKRVKEYKGVELVLNTPHTKAVRMEIDIGWVDITGSKGQKVRVRGGRTT